MSYVFILKNPQHESVAYMKTILIEKSNGKINIIYRNRNNMNLKNLHSQIEVYCNHARYF